MPKYALIVKIDVNILFTEQLTYLSNSYFQIVLNAKIFLGLRQVQKNLRRHKTLSEARRTRPTTFLASKLSKGKQTSAGLVKIHSLVKATGTLELNLDIQFAE